MNQFATITDAPYLLIQQRLEARTIKILRQKNRPVDVNDPPDSQILDRLLQLGKLQGKERCRPSSLTQQHF